jgi:hypothetical protein
LNIEYLRNFILFKIKIDDSQVMDFVRKSPVRARWANAEALKMTGGHYRKEIRSFIERGGRGWKWLHPVTRRKGRKKGPLYLLGRMVRFKYGTYRGTQRVQIGFFPTRTLKKRERIKTGRRYSVRGAHKERARMQRNLGMTDQALARLHEYGKRRRVTPRMRRRMAAVGLPLRKKTRMLETPARPMIGPVFEKRKREIPRYYEQRFFQKFFSGEKPLLKI